MIRVRNRNPAKMPLWSCVPALREVVRRLDDVKFWSAKNELCDVHYDFISSTVIRMQIKSIVYGDSWIELRVCHRSSKTKKSPSDHGASSLLQVIVTIPLSVPLRVQKSIRRALNPLSYCEVEIVDIITEIEWLSARQLATWQMSDYQRHGGIKLDDEAYRLAVEELSERAYEYVRVLKSKNPGTQEYFEVIHAMGDRWITSLSLCLQFFSAAMNVPGFSKYFFSLAPDLQDLLGDFEGRVFGKRYEHSYVVESREGLTVGREHGY